MGFLQQVSVRSGAKMQLFDLFDLGQSDTITRRRLSPPIPAHPPAHDVTRLESDADPPAGPLCTSLASNPGKFFGVLLF
jgi:hypothetical protein